MLWPKAAPGPLGQLHWRELRDAQGRGLKSVYKGALLGRRKGSTCQSYESHDGLDLPSLEPCYRVPSKEACICCGGEHLGLHAPAASVLSAQLHEYDVYEYDEGRAWMLGRHSRSSQELRATRCPHYCRELHRGRQRQRPWQMWKRWLPPFTRSDGTLPKLIKPQPQPSGCKGLTEPY